MSEKQIIIEEKIQTGNGETQSQTYIKDRFLGKGGFAKCYEFTNIETKKIYAAKIITKSTLKKSRSRQKLISEIKIHKSLKHQYIVLFEHVFEDNENVYILLEICTNNTLNELIKNRKRLTELEVQCYILQIISALIYLHKNQIIHRDLKLGNLFLSEKLEIKIGDFGLATKLKFLNEKKNTICGTPNYIAPEILEGNIGHSFEVDIWSLGVIIYTLIIGKPPYETPDVKSTYKRIKQNKYSFPESVPISDAAKNLIKSILQLQPFQRPTLNQILEHPFISNNIGNIPKTLPLQTLTCPPSASFTKQYLPQGNSLKILQQPFRILENNKEKRVQSIQNLNVILTDKINFQNQKIEKNNNLEKNINQEQNNFIYEQKKPYTAKNQNSNNNLFFISTNNNKNINNSQNNIQLPKNNYGFQNLEINMISVTQWIDYSDKYGIGYVLSNGNTGVYFNDSTKIIYDLNTNIVQYMEKNKNSQENSEKQFFMEQNPPELKKKVNILQIFRNHLKEKILQNANLSLENINTLPLQKKKQDFIFVKKWMKTKYAILFRLSNKIVQVCFFDKSEILLQCITKIVTFIDKLGNKFNYPLCTAMENQNLDMQKRLKYTKYILCSIVNKKKVNSSQQKDNDYYDI
ncbi:protein kinase domain protein [Ichthyophthirius multifiliis]|uniref:Serine/threonine-protein kinase PLK n=1 Tax=Ichthyophthirius multifiliis TaxID=5932 RepID=G0R2Z2_ICHMU|nr:protein kinase domain protein [Ichthyophthirius multifiliis]EGR28152.1 protein kinase domain protein [Ichthyophthirius multifiliis]|eukprot:XP_004027497.1 protein kinase domain protein [Ichthyophthirius multifiliis]